MLAITGVLIIAALAFLRAAAARDQVSVPSTYDTGANGLAALYELLQREDVTARRFESPMQQLYARHGALVIAGDAALLQLVLEPKARKSLDDWVKAGNTLVLLGERPPYQTGFFGMSRPAPIARVRAVTSCGVRAKPYAIAGNFTQGGPRFPCGAGGVVLLKAARLTAGSAYRRGTGRVVFIFSATPFDNSHLARAGNARFAYDVFSAAGPVAFDEQIYGYTEGKSAWSVLPAPVRYAIWIAAAALLLALAGANLPFAPPLVPQSAGVRGTGEYLASLAAMLHRAGARRDTVWAYCARIRKALAPHAAQAPARALLEQARSLELQLSANDDDVLEAARLHARVRKDYPW